MSSLTLSPQELRGLAYHFAEFDQISPLSIHPNDSPTYRVKLVPFELGCRIKQADPDETLFHVELFPVTQFGPRAEIWHVNAWIGSLSRRVKYAPRELESTTTPLQQQALQFESELSYKFHGAGLSIKNARDAAQMLIRGALDAQLIHVLNLDPADVRRILELRRSLTEGPLTITPTQLDTHA